MTHNACHNIDGRCLPPQQLHASHGHPTRQGSSSTSTHQHPYSNPALLPPGVIHQLPGFQTYHYTPQAVMENNVPTNALSGAPVVRSVEYLPRQPEYSSRSLLTEPPLTFAVRGIPGPYLHQLSAGKVVVDNPHEPILINKWLGRTQMTFDFPGLRTRPIWRVDIVVGPEKRPITRQEFGMEVASRIMMAIGEARIEPQGQTRGKYAQNLSPGEEKWRLDKIKYHHLRLISMNYYGKYWVPVLAIDK
ncbi:hypothetical protein E1B28_009156 [Marasmius oreades]|uniref:Uncharacterized protein n=1 Tax=Marasmius oreades TaxID=181124 RepID=A0A9P7S0H4_9AGAR|nr:uncharacterized protein E1B28_009156 [Marasmius oreades]KAG7092842.1 hypothetical protein E1B28_009156 [Marasmius oreades]